MTEPSINPTGLSKTRIGWKVLTIPFINAKLAGVKNPGFDTFKGGTAAFAFSPSTEEELHAHIKIPSDFIPGTIIWPTINWVPKTTNTGVVRWGLEFTIAGARDEEVYPDPITVYLEQEGCGVAYAHQEVRYPYPGLLVPGIDLDSLALIRIYRDATHVNDTFTGDAFGMDIHWWYMTQARAHKLSRSDYRKDEFKP